MRRKEVDEIYIFSFVMGLSSDSLGDFLLVDPTTRCLNAVFYRECRRKGRVILLGSDAEDRYHVGKLSENGALYNSFFCSGVNFTFVSITYLP